MARIALIQSYPYDAVAGGDGAYIQSLGQYLYQLGHDIHGLVTDTKRGRTNPIYKSFYSVESYRSWRVRNAVRVGRRAFVDYHFSRIPVKLLAKLGWLGHAANGDDAGWTRSEALWCSKQLEELRPDVIILCFGAVHFASLLRYLQGNILALPGPIPGRLLQTRSVINSHGQISVRCPLSKLDLPALWPTPTVWALTATTTALTRLNASR